MLPTRFIRQAAIIGLTSFCSIGSAFAQCGNSSVQVQRTAKSSIESEGAYVATTDFSLSVKAGAIRSLPLYIDGYTHGGFLATGEPFSLDFVLAPEGPVVRSIHVTCPATSPEDIRKTMSRRGYDVVRVNGSTTISDSLLSLGKLVAVVDERKKSTLIALEKGAEKVTILRVAGRVGAMSAQMGSTPDLIGLDLFSFENGELLWQHIRLSKSGQSQD